ncbi:hypothetical protein [Mycobacterium sp.]|uniref:hypothetical protein n=1 Tax=Mycobacterium sp. TaxID=1785 RepID=UPI003F9BE5F0
MIPELLVSDLDRSLDFWCGLCGFAVRYMRLVERFCYVELFMQPERKWYQIGDDALGVEQFLVTDPDGYLLRFQSPLGHADRDRRQL